MTEPAAPADAPASGLRVERYSSPAPLLHALSELRRRGVTPRGLLFLALDPRGEIHLATPADPEAVTTIKVGEKLGLAWPAEGRLYHYDSIHRLPGDLLLYNGDRRLAHPGDAIDVAELISDFLKVMSAKNVFFGCTPHQPGSWVVRPGAGEVALHERGMVEAVPVPQGLLARRIVDRHLFFLPSAALSDPAGVGDRWQPLYESPLGNLLMLERRIIGDRLVLTCEKGLVEVDVAALPAVREVARVALDTGFGVVGRVENAAFAVTAGKPMEWGLADMQPAILVGAHGGTLADLASELRSRREGEGGPAGTPTLSGTRP